MILANNFVGPDQEPEKLFVSRYLTPVYQILRNVAHNHMNKVENELKMLVMTMHNTNISNVLRLLTYWDNYGYTKFTRFNSSVRFELHEQSG